VTIRQHLERILRDPAIVAVELAWRWAFSASALALCAFAIFRLQHAVVIFPEEQQMLASRAPLQIAEALLEIWHRMHPLLIRLGVVVIPAVVVLWLIAATVGRGFVTSRIFQPVSAGPRWSSLSLLHVLRVLSFFLLIGAYFASSRATAFVSNPESPNYAAALAVFLVLFGTAIVIWSFINWVLSLASIFAARERAPLFDSIRRTRLLLRSQGRQLASVAAQNSTARTLVGILFTFLGLVPLVLYRIPVLFWTIEFALLLCYCAVSDLLLLARLSSYVEAAQPAKISTGAAEI
jgi:hypothetical protein